MKFIAFIAYNLIIHLPLKIQFFFNLLNKKTKNNHIMLSPVALPVRLTSPESNSKLGLLKSFLQVEVPRSKPGSSYSTGKKTKNSYYLPPAKNMPQRGHFVLSASYMNVINTQGPATRHSGENSPVAGSPNQSIHLRDSSFNGGITSLKLTGSGQATAEDEIVKPKVKLYKSEIGLYSPATTTTGPFFEKRRTLEKHLALTPTKSVSSHNATYTNKFMENLKKYKIVPPTRSSAQRVNKGMAEINELKSYIKIPMLKRGNWSLNKKNELKEMAELNLIKKPGQALSVEDEIQIKLLRKKVEISNIFRSPYITDEERKAKYKQLLLEYHPDKAKHNPRFAKEMFYFLQINKSTFLIYDDY